MTFTTHIDNVTKANEFTKWARRFSSPITVTSGKLRTSGKSLLGMVCCVGKDITVELNIEDIELDKLMFERGFNA